MVDVAQLVRASVCGAEGRGFESHLPPFKKKTCNYFAGLFNFSFCRAFISFAYQIIYV